MKSKKFFIHIGPPKTGSTTLQVFLNNQKKALLDENILYPETGIIKEEEEYVIARAGGTRIKERGPDRCHQLLPWELENKIIGEKTEFWSKLLEEIHSSDAEKVVISAEGFFHISKKSILKIRTYFENYHVRIIFYLRHPYSRAKSMYGQMVKRGKYYKSFHRFLEDYYIEAQKKEYQRIENWVNVFGKENMILKAFEQLKLKSNFESDFLKTLGVQNFEIKKGKAKNSALSNQVLRMLRAVNFIEHKLGKTDLLQNIFIYIRTLVKTVYFQKTVGLVLKPFLRHPIDSEEDRQLLKNHIDKKYILFVEEYLSEKEQILYNI